MKIKCAWCLQENTPSKCEYEHSMQKLNHYMCVKCWKSSPVERDFRGVKSLDFKNIKNLRFE